MLCQSAIYISKNLVFHDRAKHIKVDCLFTRDKVLEGPLLLTYFPTQHQLADVFTMTVPSPQLVPKLGLVDCGRGKGGYWK